MQERKLSKLVRLALVPAFAAGFALSAPAQSTEPSNEGSTASQGQQSQKQDALSYRAVRASEMIGMSVRNAEGENIGQIGDMIVNMDTGDVRYAILRFDPGLLEGESLFAVPTTELRIAADRDDVVYTIDEEKLEKAVIDRDDWDAGDDEPVAEADMARFDKAWGITQPGEGNRAHRASDLIGQDVETPAGENIGELEELVVNMAEQKVHYAVLAFDTGWGQPEQNYAFPLTAFEAGIDTNELVLDITKPQVQAMKSFPDSRYENLNDRVWVADIDRYFVTVLPTAAAAAAGDNAAAAPQFGELDGDGDGSLTREEAQAAQLDGAWQELDKDDDGRISEAEFESEHDFAAPPR